jgi:drug/metabolite transporter (DMT)-like permease
VIYLFVTAVIWGLSFALAKKALHVFTPYQLVAIRLLLGALTVWIVQRRLVTRYTFGGPERHVVWLPGVLIGVFEFALTYLLYTAALSFLPSGVIGALTLLTPIYIFIGSWLVGLEEAKPRALLAVCVSILGAYLCIPFGVWSESLSGGLWGVILINISNACFALGNIIINKLSIQYRWDDDHTYRGLLIGGLIAFICMLIDPASRHLPDLSFQAWLLPLYLGVVATGIGFFLWNKGVNDASANMAGVMGNLKAPFAIMWGSVLLSEPMNWSTWVGVFLLLTAIYLLPKRRHH